MSDKIRTYSELISIPSFKDRFNYLRLQGSVSQQTFGGRRSLNQMLYKCPEWKSIRNAVILRDGGYDLAHKDYPIPGMIFIHHLNPITPDDILQRDPKIFDLENLISCSFEIHNGIHYGSENFLRRFDVDLVERTKNDTCLWRN